jgi:hypothetical protein
MAPRGGSQLRPRNADDPTDAEFSTAAIVDHTAELAERITYSAYGEGRQHWAADVDGDGVPKATVSFRFEKDIAQPVRQGGWQVMTARIR